MATQQRSRIAGGRPKIDWNAAFAFYASDPTITKQDVAARFQVSRAAVGQHARAERWNERKGDILAQAAAQIDSDAVKTLAERNADTIRMVDKARRRYTAQLSDAAFKVGGQELAALLKIEQLIEGEATDRISLPEVREFVVRLGAGVDALLRAVLDSHLSNGKRAVVLRSFRDGFAVLLEESASGLVAIEAARE